MKNHSPEEVKMYKTNLVNTGRLDYIMIHKKPAIRSVTGFLDRSNI